MSNPLQNTYDRGIQGESIALAFLKLNGYDVLNTRYRTPYGEIDIIATYGRLLVCVEVKTRHTLGGGIQSLSRRQQERIMNGYLYFIQQHPRYIAYPVRFDLIVCAPNTKPLHFPHAFEFSNG